MENKVMTERRRAADVVKERAMEFSRKSHDLRFNDKDRKFYALIADELMGAALEITHGIYREDEGE